MGGFGSGRQSGRGTTSDFLRLDIRKLQRDGLLTPGHEVNLNWSSGGGEVGSIRYRNEANRIILIYRTRDQSGAWQDMEYPVRITWTALNFGGRRPWFVCPAASCGRRVAILYGGKVFACRHCYDLAYQCQRETGSDRACRRIDKIRERLNWDAGFLNGNGWKPKGMHWRTYRKLLAAHEAAANASLMGIAQLLKLRI